MKKLVKLKAFTLVEVTIALAIVALLATIIGVTYVGITARVKDNAIVSDANSINAAEKALAFNKNIAGRGWYSPAGNDIDLNVTLSTGNVADVNTNANGYCIRVYNPNASTYKDIGSAYTLESTSGVCAATTSTVTSCPTGFILVPGSVTYGTNNFCVMKYEAKCANASDTTVGLTSPLNASGAYDNSAANCTSLNSKTLVSTASGLPLATISQTTALLTDYTTNINGIVCSSCHLISEAEWMTIAQNVLSVPVNWSGGAIGSGYIYSGHNDNSPSTPLVADTDDNNGYSGTGNTSGNQRRTLTLSNGQVIWDFAGNVQESTQGTIGPGLQPSPSGYSYREWTNVFGGTFSVNPYPSGTGILGASGWTSVNGIGQILSDSSDSNTRGFRRGGTAVLGVSSGVLTLIIQSTTTTGGFLGLRISL